MVITIKNLIFYLFYSIGLSMVVYGLARFVKEKKLTNKKSKMAELVLKYPWLFALISWIIMILFDLLK